MNALIATAPKAIWYLTRGTGTVSFILLTAAVVLGIAHSVRWAPGHTPRFVVQDLHRNISLLVIVFVAIHVSTAVIDGFAPIRWLDAVVPFTSAYRAVWLGLGAVAFDILLAVAVTSLVRARLKLRTWKWIHGSAYVCWVGAIFHALGSGSDARQTWMLGLAACSVLAVMGATLWRVALGWSWWSPPRVALAIGAVTVPLVLAGFLWIGPLQPGWSRSAGTPAQILARRAGAVASVAPARSPITLVLPAQARFSGTASLSGPGSGGQTTLSGHATTSGTPRLTLQIDVAGRRVDGALTVNGGTIAIVPPDGAATYRGPVVGVSAAGGLEGTLSDGHGDQIGVVLDGSISPSGAFSGDLADPRDLDVRCAGVRGAGMMMGTPAAEGSRRLLACIDPSGGWVSLAEHRSQFPAPPRRGGRPIPSMIEIVDRAGLRGRGGAGFPSARKMRAVIEGGRRPIVVANGSEGEPASHKDEFLMSAAPHLVLDGAELAAAAVGAQDVICGVVFHTGRARRAIVHAIAERSAMNPGAPSITVVDVPPRYIAGEERSLVHLLNGGPPIPTASPPRPFERGVAGRPTLVQNVETLAHLALIHRFGPDWFRAVGVSEMPGTTLTSVSGAVATPGVYEIATGTSLNGLMQAAGAVEENIRAVLMGGYSGTWLSLAQARSVTLDPEGLAGVGAIFGPGIVSVLPRDACGLRETAGVMRWMAEQTAGQCGPCVHGLAAIAGATDALAAGSASPGVIERLRRLAGEVDGRGGCRYPDGAIRLLRSALGIFEADVRAHVSGDACPASARRHVLPLPVVA